MTEAVSTAGSTLAITHANALGSVAGGSVVTTNTTLELQIPAALPEPVTLMHGSTFRATTGISSLSGGLIFGETAAQGNVHVDGTELTVQGSISGISGTLNKYGPGRMVLSGGGTIVPQIRVSAGTLLVNGVYTSPNLLFVGGTLGGNGTYSGYVTLAAGSSGILEPGDPGAVGTLKLGIAANTFTTTPSSQLNFQLGVPNVQGGTLNDWVEITGNLTFESGTTLNITQSPGGNLVAGRYPLFKFTGTLAGLPQFVNVAGGLVGTVGSTSTSNGVVYVDIGSANLRWAPFADANCSAGTLGGNSTWDGTSSQWCTDGNTKTTWQQTGYTAVFTKDGDVATIASAYSPTVKDLVFQGAGIQINKGTGAGIITGSGTVLSTANASHSATIGAVLSGTAYSKTGAGTVTLSGANTFTGTMTVNEGTLGASSSAALGAAAAATIVNSGAALDILGAVGNEPVTLNAGATLKTSAGNGSLSGAVTLAGNSTMEVASSATLTLSGAVGGASGVTWSKTGDGSLITTATNTASGALSVSAGKFVLGNGSTPGSIDNVASITVNAGAALRFNNNGAVTFTKVVGGGGGLEKAGTGQLVLTGTHAYTGATSVEAGSLSIGAGGAPGSIATTSAVSLVGGTSLQFNHTGSSTFNAPISGAGTVNKFGGGTQTLGGNNSGHTGQTVVDGGTLAITHANALGDTGNGTVVNVGTTLDLQNVAVGAEPVRLAGTTATLRASSGTSSLSGAVTLNATTSTIDVGSGAQLTLSGAISGSNTVNKSSAGVLVVSGAANTHTGAVNVNGGTLLVNGSLPTSSNAVTVASGATLGGNGTIDRPVNLNAGATLEPGLVNSAGSLAVGHASANFMALGIMNFQLGAPNAVNSPLNDLVVVSGALTFDTTSTVNISQTPGGNLAPGNYTLFTHTGARNGVLTLGTAPAQSSIQYLANGVVLVIGGGDPTVRVAKRSNGGTGEFVYALTGLSAPRTTVTTVTPGVTKVGTDELTASLNQAVTITETLVPVNWPASPVAASCVDENGTASGNGTASFGALTGGMLTVPATKLVQGARIVCTFENLLNGLSGKVFNDGGAPSAGVNTGIPNDGLRNGLEAGLGGVTVNLSNCSTGSVISSTVTDASGAWALSVPSVAVGTTELCVAPVVPTGYLATGASVPGAALPATPTTQGAITYTYTPASHQVRFTLPSDGVISLDFGQVPESRWSAGGTRTGTPGGAVLHAHQFTAGTGGAVEFSTGTGVASHDGWQESIYLDTTCGGTLQAGATPLYPPSVSQAVVQGQTVCVLIQQSIPSSATDGQSRTLPAKAKLTFSNVPAPGLSATYTANDVTLIGAAQLRMLKEVRVKDSGQPRLAATCACPGPHVGPLEARSLAVVAAGGG